MSYDIEGKVKLIGPTERKSEKFQFREVVLEVMDGAYAQHPKLQFVQDRCDLLDNFQIGDNVTVSFNVKGREWNGKYFTTLEGWRIRKTDQDVDVIPPPDPAKVFADDGTDPFENYEKFTPEKAQPVEDDLPF